MKHFYILLICLLVSLSAAAQNLSMQQVLNKTRQNNTAVKIAQQSLNTRTQLNKAVQQNYLPKIDALAGYNYLGQPVKINMEAPKAGIINGAANQAAESVAGAYNQLTGQPFPANIQQVIYNTSHDILSAVYPNFNPEVGKQGYLIAGLAVRQPIYLGGKLRYARDLAEQQLSSGQANFLSAQELAAYNAALQYIQVTYYNSMIAKQNDIVNALSLNSQHAKNLLKAEIIPQYLKNWADVQQTQGSVTLQNLQADRQTALLTLQDLMNETAAIQVDKKMPEALPPAPPAPQQTANADVQLLQSKKAEAQTASKITRSASLPNIFALGTAQFFRKNLPLITPPWMIGVELQWSIFDAERKSRNLAAESLVSETDMLIQQKEQALRLGKNIAFNKMESLRRQTQSLDSVRRQAALTAHMVTVRMQNSLSSVKDVNDALQMQYETEKLYYTAAAAWQAALATYLYLSGQVFEIPAYIP